MKKFIILLMAFTAFSCSSDDNDPVDNNGIRNPYTGSVIGSWKTVGLSLNDMAYDVDCDADEPADDVYTFTFFEDGTFDVYENCFPEVLYAEGTYQTTGNVLTLNLNGQTGKAHMVDHLDENMLEWRFTIGDGGLFYNYYYLVEKLP